MTAYVSADAIFTALGVPATVALPGSVAPVETTVVWLPTHPLEEPVGAAMTRRGLQRIVSLRRDEIAAAPRGTRIVAPDVPGGDTREWVVDGTDRDEPDIVRVFVLPATERAL